MKLNKYRQQAILKLLGLVVCAPITLLGQDQTPPYNPHPDKSFEIFELCIVVLLILASFYTIITSLRISAENRIRKQLIEKGISEDSLKQMLLNGNQRLRLEALRWGLIIGCTGIGMVICQSFVFGYISFAVIFISISIGLLLFYFLSEKKLK